MSRSNVLVLVLSMFIAALFGFIFLVSFNAKMEVNIQEEDAVEFLEDTKLSVSDDVYIRWDKNSEEFVLRDETFDGHGMTHAQVYGYRNDKENEVSVDALGEPTGVYDLGGGAVLTVWADDAHSVLLDPNGDSWILEPSLTDKYFVDVMDLLVAGGLYGNNQNR